MNPPLVAVFVGTDHHPFDRLLHWIARRAAEGGTQWFVQHGATVPLGDLGPWVRCVPYADQAVLETVLQHAGAVVTHGGPGAIMDAHGAGHVPVVVPRDPARGEHVDDHQLRFTARLGREGRIRRVATESEFAEQVQHALAAGRTPSAQTGPSPEMCLRFTELVATAHQRRGRTAA